MNRLLHFIPRFLKIGLSTDDSKQTKANLEYPDLRMISLADMDFTLYSKNLSRPLALFKQSSSLPFALVATAILFISLGLTLSFIFLAPYPGFAWSPTPAGWHVMRVSPCHCDFGLQKDDLIVQIGDLDFQTYQASWDQKAFGQLRPGQEIELRVIRDGQLLQIIWRAPSISTTQHLWRLITIFFYLPFWLSGSSIWFFADGTNLSKVTPITLNYLMTLWLALGPLAPWQLFYASLLFHLLAWFIAALFIYLHLISPTNLLQKYTRPAAFILGTGATVLAVCDGLLWFPRYWFLNGMVLAFVLMLLILVARLRWGPPAERLIIRSILLGNLTTIVPMLLLVALTLWAVNLSPEGIILMISTSTTFAPLFYIHAFYRRQLGQYEVWTGRLLQSYAFFFLSVIIIFFVVNISQPFISGREQDAIIQFQLLLITGLIILSLITRPGFRQYFHQIMYGNEDKAALFQALADQITLATGREALANLLINTFTPRLKIEQSAIYLLDKPDNPWFYEVASKPPPLSSDDLANLLQTLGRYRPENELSTMSWVRLVIPIQLHHKIIGLWLLGRRSPDNFYAQSDIATITTLANQIAPVINNISLLEETQQQLAEQTALLATVQATSSSLELEVILDRLCQILGQVMNATSVYFCRWDDSQQTLVTISEYYSGRATANERQSDVGVSRHIETHLGLKAEIYRKGLLTVEQIDDKTMNEQERQYLDQYDAQSILHIPLFSQNQVIGHFEIWESQQKRLFTRREITLCQAITSQAALAIENAYLFAAERHQLKVSRTLQKIGRLLTTDLSLDQLYENIFDLLAETIPYDSVSIQLLGQDGHMYLAAARGFNDIEAVKSFVYDNKPDINKMSQEDDYVTYIPDTSLDSRWIDFPITSHILCWVGVVLQIKGRPVGVLNVDSTTKNAYNPEDLKTIAAFANQVVVALENARLYRDIQGKANQGQILYQVALNTSNIIHTDEIIEQTTQIITAHLPYAAFGFLTIDPAGGWFTPHPSATTFPAELLDTIRPLKGTLLETISANGQTYLLHQVDPNDLRPLIPEMACEMIIPVKIRQHVIGALLASSPQAFAFDDSDVQFLSTLAGQLALAIERAELYYTQQRTMTNLAQQVLEQTSELQIERDRTRIILENAGEGIFLASPTGIILYTNPAATKLTNFTGEEILGQSLQHWLGLDDQHADLQEAIVNGQHWHGELIGRRKDSLLFEFYLILAPIYDDTNTLTGFVGVQADLARIKEVERLKTALLANVSHELRTPLTNIKMYINLLQRGKENKRGYYLTVLESETDRLVSLIQDLLALSQLKAVPVDKDWVDVGKMLSNVCLMLANRAQEQQVWLDCQIAEGLPQFLGEERLLNQAFLNLVNNALMFTPAGKQVLIRGEVVHSFSTPMIRLTIQDNSQHLPAGDLSIIFDHFYRGRSPKSTGQANIGQGLAIVKEIVDRHKGYIQAHNKPNEGVEFIIELPVDHKPSL